MASRHKDGAAFVAKRRKPGVPLAHVSWHGIHEIVTKLHRDDDFAADDNVRSFVPQYREVVERIIHRDERIVEKLLKKYRSTLERLSEANGAAEIEPVENAAENLSRH